LLLDAEAAIKYALSPQGLNIKKKHLVIVGHSIGGAVGTIVASKFQVSSQAHRSQQPEHANLRCVVWRARRVRRVPGGEGQATVCDEWRSGV
jgi:pimeloyl-ACP methyl ester carboxylesterase